MGWPLVWPDQGSRRAHRGAAAQARPTRADRNGLRPRVPARDDMTRRLVVALLGFTTVILLLSVVPLGLATSARDRSDYASATRSLAQSLATLAEDSFDDTRKPLQQRRLASAAGPGVSAAVLDAAGRLRVQSGLRRVFPAGVIA